jgi:hypothetical protein
MFPALALLAGHVLSQQRPAAMRKHLIVPALCWLALLVASFFVRRWASADTPLATLQTLGHHVALASLLFLIGAACAWRFLVLERLTSAIIVLSLASLAALTLVQVGYNPYAQLKSSKSIVATLAPTPDTEVFSVRYYDQTLPFYLHRNVVLVDYVDEFALGEKIEPAHWIPTLDGFVIRWHAAHRALAVMTEDTYQQLKTQGLPMRIVYQDPRRMVVAKP